MAHEFNDLKGFLFLVLITIPQTLTTNIDCSGKPFHCLNTTHFMICVDLGGGVSSTIDDFIIPCPQTTVCEKSNRFECEFPKVEAATIDFNVLSISTVNESANIETIPPDKWTTVLPILERTPVIELPKKEQSTPSLNSDILEHLKDEFTGGNKKFFDEDSVPLSSLNFENSTAEINLGTTKLADNISTTDKSPHNKMNTENSTYVALSTSPTVSASTENVTYIREPKTVKYNNTDNKFNTVTEINQLYGNELNQTSEKYSDESKLNSTLSSFSVKRTFNINQDPNNASTANTTGILDFEKKMFPTHLTSRNDSLTTEKPSTLEKVLATTHKYHTADIVDNIFIIKPKINNSLTFTKRTNYGDELTTHKLKKDSEFSHIVHPVTAEPIEETTTNLHTNTSAAVLLKLKEIVTTTGSTIMNEINNDTNKHNEIDQKLDFNVSESITGNVSKMSIDTVSTTEPNLITSVKYIGLGTVDYVVGSETQVQGSLPMKGNSTVENYTVTPISEVLKKEDEHKDVLKSVTSSFSQNSTVYRPVNYELGTNINSTSNSFDKHEALENINSIELPVTAIKQSGLENVLKYQSNHTMQDSSGFTFETTTPSVLVHDKNIIEFKGDEGINSKDNGTFNNTKDPTDTFKMDQTINHNVNTTTNTTNAQIPKIASTFRTTSTNNSKTSTTVSPVTVEQKISTGDNYMNNLNSFLENKLQDVPLQKIISYYTTTTERLITLSSPVVFNFTTAGEISSSVKSTTPINLIQKESHYIDTKYNKSIDMDTQSDLVFPTIQSTNINGENDVQNTTTILQLKATTYNVDKSYYQDTGIGKEREMPNVTIDINKTLKTFSNDVISGVDSKDSLIIESSRKFMNHTDNTNFMPIENASVAMNTNNIAKENTSVSSFNHNLNSVKDSQEKNTIVKSIMLTSNILKNDNEMNTTTPVSILTTTPVTHFKDFSSNVNEAASEQGEGLNNLKESVNVTLVTEQKYDVTMKPLENPIANIELHKGNTTNIMAAPTELYSMTRYSLTTESITESTYSTNLSAEASSSNDLVGSTQTVEYTSTNDRIILRNTEGNSNISSSFTSSGLLNTTTNSLLPLKNLNESDQILIALKTSLIQDVYLPNNGSKTRNNITKNSAMNVIQMETGFGERELPTSNITMEKRLTITNHILSINTEEIVPKNNNQLSQTDNFGKQIVRSDVTQSNQETVVNELDSTSTLPTPVEVIDKKEPNVMINRFSPNIEALNSQHDKNVLVKVEKKIMNSNIANATEQVNVNDLDNISTVPKPVEVTVEKQKNDVVNRLLHSTMTSNSQSNMYKLPNVETATENLINSHNTSILSTSKVSTAKKTPSITDNEIVVSTISSISKLNADDLGKVKKLNVTHSVGQIVATDVGNILNFSATNDIVKNESNIVSNRVSSNTVPSISQNHTEELNENKSQIESSTVTQSPQQVNVSDLDSMGISTSPNESSSKKSQVQPTSLTIQNEINNLENPIENINKSQVSLQTVANNLDSQSILLMTNGSTIKTESYTAIKKTAPSTLTSTSQFDTHVSDPIQIPLDTSNVTQTVRGPVDSTLHNTLILQMSKKSVAEKQLNIAVNSTTINTMIPISQNNTHQIVEYWRPISNSNVTENTQQIINNESNETNFNTITERATVVETINDPHNIIGQPVLSDIIFGNVIFTNETADLNSRTQLKGEVLKNITERATNEKLQETVVFSNTSNDLNKREDLNFEANDTFIDKQTNIELSGTTQDNDTSVENYEIVTDYDKFATQKDVIPPSFIDNKSENNAGYKNPQSTIDIGHMEYLTKNISDLTQNITLLNTIKYIYNFTNNTESMFGINEGQKTILNGSDAKVQNSTTYDTISKQQIDQVNSEEPQIKNMNISYTLPSQISNNSTLFQGNAKDPPRTMKVNIVSNTFPVDCLQLPRGKYSDSKDCRKFYICVSNLKPIVGTCPNNTVFSEINKQCTKNLSHCVRNNQFHCLYEGRFSDFLRDNIYYICVKNKLNGFLRYTLQCQNGYHLNKVKVKCEENETWNQSDTSVSSSGNAAAKSSDLIDSSGNSELDCKKEGKFPLPKDSRKYYVCTKNSKDEYHLKIKSCSSEEIYDRKKKKCISSDSEEG